MSFLILRANIIGANINPGIYAFNNSLSLMNRDRNYQFMMILQPVITFKLMKNSLKI